MEIQNYYDWIKECQRLLERIKELEAENTELKKRLGEEAIPAKHEPTAIPSDRSLHPRPFVRKSRNRTSPDGIFPLRRHFVPANAKEALKSNLW